MAVIVTGELVLSDLVHVRRLIVQPLIIFKHTKKLLLLWYLVRLAMQSYVY